MGLVSSKVMNLRLAMTFLVKVDTTDLRDDVKSEKVSFCKTKIYENMRENYKFLNVLLNLRR